MKRYWSPIVEHLSPYVPGEQPGVPDIVKLNTNESPFGPSPKALEAIRAAATDELRLYPDSRSTRLRETIARRYKAHPDQVFVGNGSDEVLGHTFAALLKQPAPVIFPDVTYSFYPVYCRLLGVAYETIAVDAAMRVDVSAYFDRGGAVILANPNAPTSIALPLADIERLVKARSDVPVVIDEAYVDFGAETAAPLVQDYPNLLVIQTLSKSRALAGLRVGFALGQPGLIEALIRVKDSFNSYPLGRVAEAGAVAALEDEAYFEETRLKVMKNRALLTEALARLGFEVLPSSTNFVFARRPDLPGAEVAKRLREKRVLVRHFSGPRVSDYVRITVGSEDQNMPSHRGLRGGPLTRRLAGA